jgi:Nucleotidyl transferase AbiEii toxin, Type IV TA system
VPVDPFYRDVARIALTVARTHGFVLGGGVAWVVNGLVQRPTEDIDLFTDTDGGVAAAAGKVRDALTAAGYTVVREEADELFDGMAADIQEFAVADGDRALRLTLCRLDRHRAPVVMDVGPVMHLDDLVATKVAALVTRREVRDYIDVAAALSRYSLDRLRTRPTRRWIRTTSPTPAATSTGWTTPGSPPTGWTPRRSASASRTGPDNNRLAPGMVPACNAQLAILVLAKPPDTRQHRKGPPLFTRLGSSIAVATAVLALTAGLAGPIYSAFGGQSAPTSTVAGRIPK